MMSADMAQLPEQYKNLRDEQARLEGQRLNIMVSTSSITAISAVLSQIAANPLLQLMLHILLLVSLIWGLSMYKSLSSQIFKAITYNVVFLEKDMTHQWLQDSMTFADKFPPVRKWVKKWTHIFTLLSVLSALLTVYVFRSVIYFDQYFIEEKTHVSIWWYLTPLVILQIVEFWMCFNGVFRYDLYNIYLKKWKEIKSVDEKQ